MSETDDTDVLLLIPPDFFLVHTSGSEDSVLESSRTVVHKPPSCTAQVIGKLVDQVSSLETRLESLEINSTITDSSIGSIPTRRNWETDSCCNSWDRRSYTFPRRRRRKTAKRERRQDLSLTSFDSVSIRTGIPPLPLKDIGLAYLDSKSAIVNDSTSMEGDVSSIISTPSKKNDKLLLHEIDEFLTKVDAYEAPEGMFKEHDSTLSPENVIRATGDYLSQKLDRTNPDEVKLPSGRVISSNVLDKYIYLVKSNPQSATEKPELAPSTSKIEESSVNLTKESQKPNDLSKAVLETRSPSIRRLNFPDNKDVQPTSTPKKPITTIYSDSFKPSSNKIYDRATKVLEQYKSQNYSRNSHTDAHISKDEFKMPQMRPFTEGKDLLKNKLMDTIDTELLSLSDLWGEKEKGERGDSIKLEEERLKREHCESMIQQLQKKILEQQEKLAVAMKVDKAKDIAIAKLREAWLRLTGNLDKVEERHRASLEKMEAEVENFKMVANEAQKKTNHFETELYKALDLAHDYQNKCKQYANQIKETEENTAKALQSKDEVLAHKENEIQTLKDNYETVMRLNKQSTDCVKNLEDSLEREKQDHEQTKLRVSDLTHRLQTMSDESTVARQERELLKEKVNEERSRACLLERQLADKQNQVSELLKKCDTLDNDNKSLRKLLEMQKNDLKMHYQKQLEDAVLAKLQEFQQQLDAAEREMENDARAKETQIVDNYTKQIARIEEQHKLEVNILEEKQREEIKLYRLQLAQSSEKIGLLENKLESYRRRRGQIASQLHGVMEAQWRQALLILTNGHPSASSNDVTRADSTASTPIGADYGPPKIPPLTMPSFPTKALHRNSTESQTAHSLGGHANSDRALNFDTPSDHELQQYVKMLLSKPPNLEGSGDSLPRDVTEEPTSDRTQDKGKHKRQLNKPPWKA